MLITWKESEVKIVMFAVKTRQKTLITVND